MDNDGLNNINTICYSGDTNSQVLLWDIKFIIQQFGVSHRVVMVPKNIWLAHIIFLREFDRSFIISLRVKKRREYSHYPTPSIPDRENPVGPYFLEPQNKLQLSIKFRNTCAQVALGDSRTFW